MAKKLFKELNGVRCDVTYTGVKGMRALQVPHYTVTNTGDTLYYIDINNNFEIVNVICKYICNRWRNQCEIFVCFEKDAEKYKDYVPAAHSLKAENAPKDFIVSTGKSNRSHNGLLFTDFKEAQEYQAKLRQGKAFFQLKAGDTVYAVSGDASEVAKLTIKKIAISRETYEKFDSLCIYFEGKGDITLGHTRYEDKAGDLLDDRFYCHDLNGFRRWDSGNSYFFTSEEDANKLLSDRAKRKQKSATVKYIKQMENYDGKPIKHHDSNNNDLHYGDKVAYAVSGGSSSPFVSIGKVIGETEQKVTIQDTAKKDEQNHNVYPCSVILIEAAKTNVKSGFSFVNAK